MAIQGDTDNLPDTFDPVIEAVMDAVTLRAQDLLFKHINTDVYGISENEDGTPAINKMYTGGTMVGSAAPSYEFRDNAWDIKTSKLFGEYVSSIIYNSTHLSDPSVSNPYLHGNYYKDIVRKDILPELLNVNGIAREQDFNPPTFSAKERHAFWDSFEKDLESSIGGWLYTEFNKRGLKIPSLKDIRPSEEL